MDIAHHARSWFPDLKASELTKKTPGYSLLILHLTLSAGTPRLRHHEGKGHCWERDSQVWTGVMRP